MKVPVKKKAAALHFDSSIHHAPVLLLKGEHHKAHQIIKTAEKHSIPVEKNPVLAEFLCSMPENTEIPENLYKTVSVIFAVIYRENEKMKREAHAADER